MPESPEVQVLVEFLAENVTGRTLAHADVLEFRAVKTRTAPPTGLVGRTFTGAERHGKHVALALEDGTRLVVSLGRHGWIRWRPAGTDEPPPAGAPPALAEFGLDGGDRFEVTDAGSWVSLGLFVVDDALAVPAIGKLGPDPAASEYSPADLDVALGGRRKQVKAVLQEQESIAGIGNAYSDEILHLAKISPVVHAAALDDGARERLYEAIVATVRGTIDARRGIPIDQLKAAKVEAMRVHGRPGEACPVCGDTIGELTFSGAAAHYCPTCQTGGVAL